MNSIWYNNSNDKFEPMNYDTFVTQYNDLAKNTRVTYVNDNKFLLIRSNILQEDVLLWKLEKGLLYFDEELSEKIFNDLLTEYGYEKTEYNQMEYEEDLTFTKNSSILWWKYDKIIYTPEEFHSKYEYLKEIFHITDERVYIKVQDKQICIGIIFHGKIQLNTKRFENIMTVNKLETPELIIKYVKNICKTLWR